jgi:SAM-dependent methyltransferase
VPSLWDVDGGAAAEGYADLPYGHYKHEVYPLFNAILDAADASAGGAGIRVLDIGAGPGHLAVEFYKQRPQSRTRFALLDVGQAMLDIARRRLAELGFEAQFLVRDFNLLGWHQGLGQFDVIVSNNALFHVSPDELGAFYQAAYGLLSRDGLLLNQQSFAYEQGDFAQAIRGLPCVLDPLAGLDDEERRLLDERVSRHKKLCADAEALRRERLRQVRQTGGQVPQGPPPYANLHLPASAHVAHMRAAGFVADCIWRKMEFAVLMGMKGTPFGG